MVWGYLAEFWDKLTDVGDYTIAWFQGIGNAVAGAIGSLFEDLIHHIYDVFYIFQYLIDQLQTLISILFTPLTWVFNFVKGFFISAFADPIEPTITWTFDDQYLAVFQAIPYWNILMFGIGAGLSILVLVFIFKRLSSI